jgi:hypothetical protein
MTRAERRTHWQTIIEKQAASGMSVAAYCRDTQIKSSYFYSWRRRLREQQRCTGGFLELISDRMTSGTSGIRIHLGDKLHIEVDRRFDSFTLRAVVETLGHLCR